MMEKGDHIFSISILAILKIFANLRKVQKFKTSNKQQQKRNKTIHTDHLFDFLLLVDEIFKEILVFVLPNSLDSIGL